MPCPPRPRARARRPGHGRVLTAWLGIIAFSQIHLLVVQLVAWSLMLADRVPDRGWSAAVDSTFSGREPCCRCRAVETERNRERGPLDDTRPSVAPGFRNIAGRLETVALPEPPMSGHACRRDAGRSILENPRLEPPVPPPRAPAFPAIA